MSYIFQYYDLCPKLFGGSRGTLWALEYPGGHPIDAVDTALNPNTHSLTPIPQYSLLITSGSL